MSKILFVMKYPLEEAYSVKGKFDGQMKAARSLGYDVYYIAYDHKATYLIHGEEKTCIKKIAFGKSRHYAHTKAFFDLYDSVTCILRDEQFDIAYIRHAPLSFKGVGMCRKLQKIGCKVVVEIATYPQGREKQPTLPRKLYALFSGLCWRSASKSVSLFTLIGEYAPSYNGVPALNISNGIDADAVELRKPCFDDDKVHLLAVASMSSWHGYDRIIRSIAALNNADRDRVVLDMVGNEGDGSLDRWKQLTSELSLEKQVVFHGKRTGMELNPFYDKADIGICSLGMYRIGFESGSILKLREYTARGLPFVYAANDPALPTEQSFCLHVSNDDKPINMKQIMEFAMELRKKHDMPRIMHEYAQKFMSWEGQLKQVFDRVND